MPIDTSIYNNVQQANPLGQLAQFAQAQNALNQNKLFQAQLAIGPILQQSVDPETGQPDFNKAFVQAAANPATAPAASSLLQMGIQRQQTQQEIALKQLEQAGIKYKAIGDAAGGLLELGNNVKQQDVVGSLAGLYGSGLLDKNTMMSTLSSLPPDGANLAAWLKQRAQQASGAASSINNVMGTYAERNAMVELKQPDGSVVKVPRAALPTVGPSGPGGAASAQPDLGGIPQGQGPQAGQAPMPQGQPQMPSQGPQQQGQGPQQALGTLASPSAAMASYQGKSGENQAAYQDEVYNSLQTLPPTLERIKMMRDAMNEFKPGGGQDMYLDIAKAMQATGWFPPELVDKVAGGSIKDAQTLKGLIAPTAIQNLKNVAQGTGRVMKSEVDAFLGNEDITTDPRALDKLFQFAQDSAKNYYDQSQAIPQFKQLLAQKDPSVKGYDISDFPSWYSKQLSDKGSLPFGKSQMPGAPSSKTVHWAIRNGKLVQE